MYPTKAQLGVLDKVSRGGIGGGTVSIYVNRATGTTHLGYTRGPAVPDALPLLLYGALKLGAILPEHYALTLTDEGRRLVALEQADEA